MKNILRLIVLSAIIIFGLIIFTGCDNSDCTQTNRAEWVVHNRNMDGIFRTTYWVTIGCTNNCHNHSRRLQVTQNEFEVAIIGETYQQWAERRLQRIEGD